jgi:hypothetical protein
MAMWCRVRACAPSCAADDARALLSIAQVSGPLQGSACRCRAVHPRRRRMLWHPADKARRRRHACLLPHAGAPHCAPPLTLQSTLAAMLQATPALAMASALRTSACTASGVAGAIALSRPPNDFTCADASRVHVCVCRSLASTTSACMPHLSPSAPRTRCCCCPCCSACSGPSSSSCCASRSRGARARCSRCDLPHAADTLNLIVHAGKCVRALLWVVVLYAKLRQRTRVMCWLVYRSHRGLAL